MTDITPDLTDDYFDFMDRFGVIGIENPSCIFVYTTNNETFKLPDYATKDKIEELYKKSLSDNKDYILEYVKKYGERLEKRQKNTLY